MVRRVIKFLIAGLGLLIGYSLTLLLFQSNLISINSLTFTVFIYVFSMLVFGIIAYILSERIIKGILAMLDRLERALTDIPTIDFVFGAAGLLLGLIFSFFISFPLRSIQLPYIGDILGLILTIIVYVVLGTVGARLGVRFKPDIVKFFKSKSDAKGPDKKKVVASLKKVDKRAIKDGQFKVLDTSVLIDGRISAIVESGFIDGPLIIPDFVLEELQFIADSSDSIKRERGRRGLDIVKDLQKSKKINVILSDMDYEDTNEVDIKLLKLTKDLEGKVMTNDYNLNKVASVQGIPVLNINDLANSVKTIVLPGEKMNVNIIKEGKEKKQGLAYLDDGTMIVVEDAKNLIGESIEVTVTTVLQTAAGKMIFAKPID